MINKPIFILGAHKSGTTLLRSLLDSHPELFVLPIETHAFKHNGYWIDYSLKKNLPKKLSPKQIEKNYIGWVKTTDNLPDDFKGGEVPTNWDLKKFKEYLSTKGNYDTTKDSINTYFTAIAHSLNQNLNLRFVEKSVEHAEFAIDLEKMFPGAKFVHIVRNPYANFVSLRKFTKGSSYPLIKPLHDSFYNNYYFLYKNSEVIKNYEVVKYEDLVSEPERVMNLIAEFLEISKMDCLYKPTNSNEIWSGNSVNNNQFTGINADHLNDWQKEIYPLECDIINKSFDFILQKFDYGYFSLKNQPLRKIRNERFKTYLRNRMFVRSL